MNIKFVLTLFAIIATETAAQYFLQKRVKDKNNVLIMLGVVFYAVVAALYYMLLKDGSTLAMANSLWNAGTEISVALVGFFLFGQKLSIKQITGLILTIVGVNLLG